MLSWISAKAQEARSQFDPRTSLTAFASYSNDSSPILLGQERNRRWFELGSSYQRRIAGGRWVSWRYSAELLPVILLNSPHFTASVTSTPNTAGIMLGIPASTFVESGLVPKRCSSWHLNGPSYFLDSSGAVVLVGSVDETLTCTSVWTYGGGLSPLGQRVNLLPQRRVQPYLLANAGFAMFTANIPASDGRRFNFTFEGGGGIEVYSRPGRSFAIDVRYHHLSDDGTTVDNPGLDNAIVRLSYRFSR